MKLSVRIAAIPLLAVAGQAQTGVPTFTADRVLPSGSARAAPLAPGMLVSIYGSNLGPVGGCVGQADTRRRETPNPQRAQQSHAETLIYPAALCGVQVLVGDLEAGLLYVQDKQINFHVPQEIPLGGTAEIKVIYEGRSNSPVRLPVGLGKTVLSVEGTARVGGPIWIKIDLPFGSGEVQYPVSIVPTDFGCYQMEVRQNGVPLAQTIVPTGPMMYMGPPCGIVGMPGYPPQHRGRLPLHLIYRFEKPGIYEVRYTHKPLPFGPGRGDIAQQSEWTRLEILPAQTRPQGRAPADPGELLSDYLPGILGFPDAASLQIVLGYLYHPNDLVRRYAASALAYWPRQEIDAQVAQLIRTKGPTDTMAYLIAAHRPDLIDPMLPYLLSDNPILLRGAILGASGLISDLQQNLPLETRARAENALLGAVEHVVRTGNAEMVNSFAVALGAVHNDRARDVLWNFFDRKVAAEQSLIAITWHKDLRDLPRLGALLVSPAAGDPMNRELASIPYALRNSYGEAALPFLEAGVKESEYVWVRVNCARELVLLGRPAGFAFIADAMEGNRFYKREMVEYVRERFPELKGADEGAVLEFVRLRASLTR